MTSGKPPRSQSPAQQRLAARRAAEAAARAKSDRRRRLVRVLAPIGVAVVVVAVLVAVKVATGSGPKSGQSADAAGSAVVAKVTGVPASSFDAVGAGTIRTVPKPINAPALTADGKPRVLYVGAEYCPYCATERWAVVAALARFGTFNNLGQTASSPSDVNPNTATLTFHGASFTSNYISFTGKEIQSNQVKNGQYAPLDKLSAADEQLVKTYDAPPYVPSGSAGSIPFTDIGGKYMIPGASYDPRVLQGKTHQQIADALADPNSPIAKAVLGAANVITAAVCQTTNGAPASVCDSAGVQAGAARLNNAD